jgi:hypothetical protein
MPSQLLTNDKIGFIVCKPFNSRGKEYAVGDDFPQEEARDIEVFVRARYVVPFIESAEDKKFVRQWHQELKTREEVMAKLNHDRVQLLMPAGQEPDSEEVVNLERLTHPETTPDAEELAAESEEQLEEVPEESGEELFDPGEHTVTEVNAYLAEHPEDRDRVLAEEEAGRGRKGILEA